MARYRKRPVEVEAWRWPGDLGGAPAWFMDAMKRDVAYFFTPLGGGVQQLVLRTLEGPMTASPGDWIICGVLGEVYACKEAAFALTYDAVACGAEAVDE